MHNRSVNARQPLRPLCSKTHRQHCAPSRTSGADRYRYPLPSVNNHTIQAAAVEVQRRTPEALQRTEEPYAGLLPHVEVKLKAISGCDRRPEARLLDQAAQAGTVAKRVMWLRKAADYLQEGTAHHAACRKGCSHCCHISVMVSRAEAQVIARETGAHLNTAAGQFMMQGFEEQSETIRAATLQAYGAACTFLREGFHSVLQYVRKRLKPMTEDES